jgi:hypothetical protein
MLQLAYAHGCMVVKQTDEDEDDGYSVVRDLDAL